MRWPISTGNTWKPLTDQPRSPIPIAVSAWWLAPGFGARRQVLEIPDCIGPVGVSVDAEGFDWVVDQVRDAAQKIDGQSFDVVGEVGGLTDPYTYSDMTGAGLSIVAMPPQG